MVIQENNSVRLNKEFTTTSVGREGFEPPKAAADRFTVCCV